MVIVCGVKKALDFIGKTTSIPIKVSILALPREESYKIAMTLEFSSLKLKILVVHSEYQEKY